MPSIISLKAPGCYRDAGLNYVRWRSVNGFDKPVCRQAGINLCRSIFGIGLITAYNRYYYYAPGIFTPKKFLMLKEFRRLTNKATKDEVLPLDEKILK